MNESRFLIDHEAIARILESRGLDFLSASKISHVHHNTIRRMAGDYVPKGMPAGREYYATAAVITRLALALRVEPQYFAPDLPKEPLLKMRPTPVSQMGKQPPFPGDHRNTADAKGRRKRLIDLAADELETSHA